jgi:ABC-type amino acid transport substrate-binding protein
VNRSSARRLHLHRRTASAATALLVTISVSGCGLTIPADPDGTLDTVTSGELRIGTAPDGDLVRLDDGEPSGSIVDLVDGFAASIHADAQWTVASEETLVTMLDAGDLDLIAGGITTDTPWVDSAGVTRGYADIEGAEGREIVMLVPLGENAFLSSLERFLDEEVGG